MFKQRAQGHIRTESVKQHVQISLFVIPCKVVPLPCLFNRTSSFATAISTAVTNILGLHVQQSMIVSFKNIRK